MPEDSCHDASWGLLQRCHDGDHICLLIPFQEDFIRIRDGELHLSAYQFFNHGCRGAQVESRPPAPLLQCPFNKAAW